MSEHYVLDAEHNVKPAGLMEWAHWLEADAENRRVASTDLPQGGWVSTVFLGLDHQWGEGPLLLFETMVFPSKDKLDEQLCWRYSTWDEAVAGHARAVGLVEKLPLGELADAEPPEPSK